MNTTAKQAGFILLASAVVAVAANLVHPRRIPWVQDWSSHVEARAKRDEIHMIPLSVALEKLQSSETVFVDARPQREFETGHIAGAISIPLDAMDEQFEQIGRLVDSGRELVVYCSGRTCDDALLLAKELKVIGATNLSLYIDGFEIWSRHGGAVEP